jgi:predicted ribosomally synthesized peptide with SipW-like signal peptide
MKSKILLSVLSIALAGALIAGATLAWFTDENEVPAATFVAGTVEVDADEPTVLPKAGVNNVNPGDSFNVKWFIHNKGTKATEFRVKLEKVWYIDDDNYAVNSEENGRLERLFDEYGVDDLEALEDLLNTNNVTYEPAGDDWKMHKGWIYYTSGPVPAGENRILELIVTFDGKKTDNKYMGATFTLGGIVEAVQASNGAPKAVWGDVWDEVKGEEPSEPEPEIFKVTAYADKTSYGTVTGSDEYKVGDTVTLEATPNPGGYRFMGWEFETIPTGFTPPDSDSETLSFEMPNGDVVIKAIFAEVDFELSSSRSISTESVSINGEGFTKVTISRSVKNYTLNGEQSQETRTIKAYIQGYGDYYGEADVTIGQNWKSFSITITIPGSALQINSNDIRIEIDGKVKQW